MNPALRDVLKEELQKLLYADFIYPIFNNQWVSPLVLVLKKHGIWHICIDYRELRKSTLKYYFPLPFIDHVLDTLAGKYFYFLNGFADITRYRQHLRIKKKPLLHVHGVHFAYRVLPFGLCNASTTFQREILAIVSDLECVEIYMDDFSMFGDSFQEALKNI